MNVILEEDIMTMCRFERRLRIASRLVVCLLAGVLLGVSAPATAEQKKISAKELKEILAMIEKK